MAPPLVSVVIPTFDRADLLVEAARSVIAQTVADWELIVADDGSNDDSAGRIAALDDPRIRFLAGQHRGWSGTVRNRGAAVATGTWLAFLDSDDLWLTDRLARQLAAVSGGGAGWCYADHGLIAEDGAFVPKRAGGFAPLDGDVLLPLIREETSASISTLLVRRDLFVSLGGFDRTLRYRPDLDLAFQLAAVARAAVVDTPLAMIREHDGRLTRGVEDPHARTMLVFERLERRAPGAAAVAAARRRKRALGIAGARFALRKGKLLEAARLWLRGRRKLTPRADPRSSR